ncbi:MAG: deoxyribonuclease IV [Thermoleophilia bacterium]
MASKAKPAAPLLGLHVSTAGGLVKSAVYANGLGCTTIQIMSGNPSAWKPGKLDPEAAAKFRAYLDEFGPRPVFLHAGYLINLSCRRGRNAPLWTKSIRLLQDNLDRAALLGCEYVVVHLGSSRGYGPHVAMASLLQGLRRLRTPAVAAGSAGTGTPPPVLLLENSAGQGDAVGSSFQELAAILKAARDTGVSQPLGICLDTAHMWGAGYPLTSAVRAGRIIDEFDALVGVENLQLIHLNDSPVPLGSHKDRHEHLGCGLMSLPALRAIVRDKRLRHVAMVMETPGGTNPSDMERMDDLRRLAGVRGSKAAGK